MPEPDPTLVAPAHSQPESPLHGVPRSVGERWIFLEYLALCGVAFAQPLLDILARNASYLVTSGTTAAQAFALVGIVCLAPPAALWGVDRLSGVVGPRFRSVVHYLLTAGVLVLLILQVVRRATSLEASEVIIAAVAAGIIAASAVHKWSLTRQFLHYLAWTPLLAATVFLAFSPASTAIFSEPPAPLADVNIGTASRVVFIVLDEMPTKSILDGNGHVDRELYPNFARLEQTTTWYRNSTTVAAFTQGAVPALVTGRSPRSLTTLPTNSAHPGNLFALLESSYTLNVHEAVTRLCPSESCTSFDGDGLAGLLRTSTDLWRDSASPKKPNKAATDFDDANASAFALDSATNFIDSIDTANNRQLDFLHVMLPHYPWRYINTLQGHRATFTAVPGEKYLEPWSATGARLAHQQHLLQVQATDTLIGKILDRLQSLNALDDTMLIVTADHGISFGANEPARNATASNTTDLMWTPLFIKYPKQHNGIIDDRPAFSIDVLPTIADVLNMQIPAKLPKPDGRSLLAEARASEARIMFPATGLTNEQGKIAFEQVLATRAVAAGPDPRLRIYRDHPWGELVGSSITTQRGSNASAKAARAHIDNRKVFQRVDHDGQRAEWLRSSVEFSGVKPGTSLAFALNGTVASTCIAVRDPGSGTACSFVLPPSFVRDGRNTIALFQIDGSLAKYQLTEVRIK